MEEKKRKRLPRYMIVLIVSLCLIFLGGMFAGLFQTNFGSVKVSGVNFPMRDGQSISADLFKPDSATHENKAPLIVVVAGFQRSKETQAGIAFELARRGFVVINIDPYSQGDSSSSAGRESGAIASSEGYGAFDLIEYIYDSKVLNYVDVDRIGITGHSAGGNAAYQAAVRFGKESVNNGGKSKIQAAYISGYVISIDSSLQYAKSNMGFDYALYDEGAFRNKKAGQPGASEEDKKPTADMTIAVESHDFVNSVLPEAEKLTEDDLVEMGRIYGNPNTRTMRQVFNTPIIHALQPYAAEANTSLLSFFEIAMGWDYAIPADSHIWWMKEIFTTIALVGAFMFIVPFAMLLLKIPFFASVKCPVPEPEERRTVRGKILFWIAFAISALVAGLTFIPLSKLTAAVFPKATQSMMTWFFPQRMNNTVLLWSIVNGIVGMAIFLAFFFGTYFIKKALHAWSLKKDSIAVPAAAAPEVSEAALAEDGAAEAAAARAAADTAAVAKAATPVKVKLKRGMLKVLGSDEPARLNIDSWGLKIKPVLLLKTFLLALAIFGGFYALLHMVYFFFHVDFRMLFIVAARPLNLKVVLQALMYVPLFFIFYLSNSIRVNGNMREKGQKEWVSLLIAGFGNTVGLILILAIQYIGFGATGTVFWTEAATMTEWLYVNILFGLIPVMFILPLFNRWFFQATGKSWLGPMVMCLILITMMLNNSVAYIPL